MSIEQAFEELEKYAQQFTNIGDAQQAIKINKDEFLHKWLKVYQYYTYIIERVNLFSEEWARALDIISDIECDNPSLEDWVEKIINYKQQKRQTKSKNDIDFDPTAISEYIDSLVTEIKNIQIWDTEYIGNIEWQL